MLERPSPVSKHTLFPSVEQEYEFQQLNSKVEHLKEEVTRRENEVGTSHFRSQVN